MTVTLSFLVILGVFLALLIRYKALGIGAAVVALLFGFFVARTGAADSIDQIMTVLSGVAGDF